MEHVTIDGGTILLASEDERLISARLLPFGEQGKSNLGRFTVGKGVLTLPADATVAIINDGHRRELPLGAGVVYAERADGIHASWRLAKSPEGDAALADIKAGRRNAVSVEAEVVVENGVATSGRVFGAALVSAGKQPAFPSALLMATAADDAAVDDPEDPTTAHYTTMSKDPASGETFETETTVEEEEDTDPETGAQVLTRTTTEVTTITPGTADAGAAPVTEPSPTDSLFAQRAGGTVAPTMNRAARRGKAKEEPKTVGRQQLYAMLAHAAPSHRGGRWKMDVIEQLLEPRVMGTLYAELDDITFDAAGSPADMIVPQWIGELWSGRAYVRRWAPLFGSGTLTSPTVKGWRWVVKPEVGKWEGNKTDVPSGPATTEPYDVEAQPFAGAHDIDRRFRDFNVPEFWDGYFTAMTESYAKQSDLYVPDELLDPANSGTTAVAGGVVPANVSPVMAKIIDGALAVLDEDVPSFAAVSKADYRSLMLTREQDNLAFLNATLGLEDGTFNPGSFTIVPTSHVKIAGADGTAGKVLVGCRSAATVHELPGSPVRVEGLDIARGGIDPGLYGYTALAIHNPAALALVSPHA